MLDLDKGSSCKQETGFATSHLYDSFAEEACVTVVADVQLASKKGFYWMSNFPKAGNSDFLSFFLFVVTFQGPWSQPYS